MFYSELYRYRFHVKIPLQRKTTQIMKAVLTFFLFIFLTTSVMAQGAKKEVKVATITVGVELNVKIEKTDVYSNKVARLYRFKNSRVKKALKFQTKKQKAKIA